MRRRFAPGEQARRRGQNFSYQSGAISDYNQPTFMKFEGHFAVEVRRAAGWRAPRLCVLLCSVALALAPAWGREHGVSGAAPHIPATAGKPQGAAPKSGQKELGADAAGKTQEALRAQIAEDCASLLKLATELKAEMDKSGQDKLSMAVVRKAAEIRELAHQVQQEMKPAAGK